MPPKGTLGVAKCQNLKIQRSPHTGTGFGFEIAQKLTKIHWKVQLSNAIIVRTEQKNAPLLKKPLPGPGGPNHIQGHTTLWETFI